MKKVIGLTLIFVLIVSLGIYGSIKIANGFQDSQNEYLCARLKLSVLSGSLEDINRMEEIKRLCSDENCTDYFENKIKNRQIMINDTLEGKHCERFGFQEKSEVDNG